MADINTLLGMNLGPNADMQALAQQLRGQQDEGRFLGMSTLAPVAQYGQNLQQGATDAATRGGVLRQSMAKERQAQENYNATALAKTVAAEQANKDAVKAAETKNTNAVTAAEKLNKNKKEAVDLANSLSYDDFKPFQDAEGNKKMLAEKNGKVYELDAEGEILQSTNKGWMPYEDPRKNAGKRGIQTTHGSPSQQEKFETSADESENQLTVFGQFKDEYASNSKVPFMGSVENFISRRLPATASDEMIQQQRWWRDYKKQYENIERHSLFGSALTTAEIKAWKEANVDADSSPEQTRDAMATLTYLTRKLAEKTRENAEIKGRDQAYIDNNYGYLDNYEPFVDLSVVPEGIDMNEWEELTYAQRQDALEMLRQEQEALAVGGQ